MGKLKSPMQLMVSLYYPVDTGRILNVHKTFRRHRERLLNVLCTFNVRPVSTMYWLLVFKNDNLKYKATSQREASNPFPLFYIFFSSFSFLLSLFKISCAKKHVFNLSHILYFEFLLCNVVHSVGNLYWWTFLRELILFLFATN